MHISIFWEICPVFTLEGRQVPQILVEFILLLACQNSVAGGVDDKRI